MDVDGEMRRQLLFILLFAIITSGLFLVSAPYGVTAQSSNHGITRVQSIDGGAVNYGQFWHDNATNQDMFVSPSNQTIAKLPNIPKEGDVLIASIGVQTLVSNAPAYSVNVSSITQQGVVWTRQVRNSYWGWNDAVEIWLGVVGANADTSLTINTAVNLTQGADFFAVAYGICEYSGVATVSPLDQTAISHSTEAITSTGTTNMTSKANELWVGAVFVESSVNQTGPLNGFQLVGGTIKGTNGRITTSLLDRVVDKKGQAWSGTGITAEYTLVGYLGCIATFTASDQTPSNPDATVTPTPNPTTGTNTSAVLQFSCQSTTASTIKVNIQGTLTGNGAAISNEPITFSYSINNGATFTDLSSVFTDSQGHFSIMWNPTATGSYQINANWAGNNQYPALEKTVNFIIVPSEQSQSQFSINSNSTMSALSFDSAKKQLSFSVSGESGSTGYVEIYVPKTLMSDVAGLEVKLDGARLDYTVADQGDAWLITFTYHHSTHEVIMSLNSQTGVSSFDSGVVGWILIAATIIPLAAAITYIATKRSRNKSQTSQ